MPYIEQYRREAFEQGLSMLKPMTVGELNYLFTMLSLGFVKHHGESYARWNDVVGALEAAKMELYRRRVAPYEDKKIKENGDVGVES